MTTTEPIPLWQRYDVRVPRYTSYPTAPHFHEDVTADNYAEWLRDLAPAEPLSLYFHIPFCAEMCWYCGCHTKIVKRYEPIRDYVNTLLDEVDLVAAALPARMTVGHLHWGGGSPSMLTGDDWQRTMDRLRRHFEIAPDAEVALELDPRTTTKTYVATLAEAGVNRVSIGVQDFHADVQRAINREQPFEVTRQVVDWLRGHGIENINLDLMYGLPFQTEARVLDMVDQAVMLAPTRIALFGYAHVPWMKRHQRLIDEAALPDIGARWRQAESAAGRLIEHGYRRVGLDHFARADDSLSQAQDEGRLGRNFQGYTSDAAETLLAFGASAIGALPSGYVQNTPSLKEYARHIDAGRFAVARGIALDRDDRMHRDIINALMCDLTVDLAEVSARHGRPKNFDGIRERLLSMRDDDLVILDSDRVTVTERGRPLVRVVAAEFDAYLDRGGNRHSSAV